MVLNADFSPPKGLCIVNAEANVVTGPDLLFNSLAMSISLIVHLTWIINKNMPQA